MSKTAPDAAAGITGQKHSVGAPSAGVVGDVLAAVWCRSVGASWTLELYELGRDGAPGTIIDWIPSGVPIAQPEPDELARGLLAQRGLQLFRDSSAGPCSHNRRGIGYVCRNAE
ncbi:MAG: hypothetical protein ACRDRI_04645 [Pseudonocardiaceae bacterium]